MAAACPPQPALLDFETAMAISESISSEIDSEQLVETLLKVALAHAGADRGALFLHDERGRTCVASAKVAPDGIVLARDASAAADPPWTVQALERIEATLDTSQFDSAELAAAPQREAQVAGQGRHIVLCVPLIKRARLAGILYFEKDSARGGFSSRLVAVLRLVAAQAVVALENARLYRELKCENQERQRVEEGIRRTTRALADSEERFRAMANATPDVIWISEADPERLLYVNPSFERIWGVSVAALHANVHLWVEGIHPDDRARVGAAFVEWTNSDGTQPWDIEFRVQQPGGAIHWLHERGVFLGREEGRARRIGGIATDVTAQRMAVLALHESEQRFALATEGSSDGIYDWDLGTNMMFLSHRCQQLYGLEPGDPIRPRPEWAARVTFHPEESARQRQQVDDYLAGKLPGYDNEWRVLHPDGSWRWIRIRGVCKRDHLQRALRMAGSVSDIDGRRRAESAMLQMQRLEAVGTLAGGVAHDFNNILAVILGFGEASMRYTRPGSRMRRDLERILSAGERGRALVERILAFSRSSVGARIVVDLESVIAESLTMIEAMAPRHLSVDFALASNHATVVGDPTQFHQLVMNLATNGMQAMPFGGLLRIRLACATLPDERTLTTGPLPPGDYVVLCVQDSGTGIDPAIRGRIFDPFFTTKEVGSGTGLGLSLVHGIVAELGGAIEVSSEQGIGSCFSVYLPRNGERADLGVDAPVARKRGVRGRILLVDDEEALVRLTGDMLMELGYEPVPFTSAEKALAAFVRDPASFDAIVTDSRMPSLSGVLLIKAVRAVRSDLPTLLVSGFLAPAAAADARAAGADIILNKPVPRANLASALADLLAPARLENATVA